MLDFKTIHSLIEQSVKVKSSSGAKICGRCRARNHSDYKMPTQIPIPVQSIPTDKIPLLVHFIQVDKMPIQSTSPDKMSILVQSIPNYKNLNTSTAKQQFAYSIKMIAYSWSSCFPLFCLVHISGSTNNIIAVDQFWTISMWTDLIRREVRMLGRKTHNLLYKHHVDIPPISLSLHRRI